jgi:hypothetical protein
MESKRLGHFNSLTCGKQNVTSGSIPRSFALLRRAFSRQPATYLSAYGLNQVKTPGPNRPTPFGFGPQTPRAKHRQTGTIYLLSPVMNDKMPIQRSSLIRRAELLKTVGVAVLVLGLVAASVVYWSGEKRSETVTEDPQTLELGHSWKDGSLLSKDLKGSSRTIEMNDGKAAVLVVKWLHQWEELKPHQRLAAAITTIATLVAICCFVIAKRLLPDRI